MIVIEGEDLLLLTTYRMRHSWGGRSCRLPASQALFVGRAVHHPPEPRKNARFKTSNSLLFNKTFPKTAHFCAVFAQKAAEKLALIVISPIFTGTGKDRNPKSTPYPICTNPLSLRAAVNDSTSIGQTVTQMPHPMQQLVSLHAWGLRLVGRLRTREYGRRVVAFRAV
jgi:hypothetical protein